MKRFVKRYAIILGCMATPMFVSGQEKKEIKYDGSSTIANFIKEAEKTYGKITFIINDEVESDGGEAAIVEGRTDIAGVARIPRSEVLAKGVLSTHIGWDAIAVIVNSETGIINLSTEQLKDIFTGKITNWKELGGADLKIQPLIVDKNSATRNIFRSIILKEDDYAGSTTITPDIEIINKVKSTPGAIGHISLSFLNGNGKINKVSVNNQECDKLNPDYPIKRPLYLLWWPGRKHISEFIDWAISKDGQEIVTKYFIGISKSIAKSPINHNGSIVVYTETSSYESGGNYYYPHRPYEILNSSKERIMYIPNHINNTDEIPTKVTLSPGTYLIRPEMTGGKQHDFWITVEPGKTTSVDIETLLKEVEKADKKKAEPEKKETTIKKTVLEKTKFYSDFRFRVEEDWNSRKTDGTHRDDRGRLRIRFRVGFDYNWNEHISFGGRIRVGDKLEQQSPHQTLGDEFEPKTINLDKAYLKGNYAKGWFWLGKNDFPFWKQNELWWDDDVLPEGVAMGSKFITGDKISIKPTIGYFIVNSLGKGLERDPALIAGQIAVEIELNKIGITLASGYYRLNDIPNQNDGSGTFKLDYSFLNSGIKFDFKTKLPISTGFDYLVNLKDYSDNTSISTVFQDETDGFVASLSIGKLKGNKDFLIGYYYAYIPKLSVVDYLAQDDWVRWNHNNVTGTRSSNFKGHEIRLGYALGANLNVVARAYFVDGIVTTGSFKETNNRVRLDVNIGF